MQKPTISIVGAGIVGLTAAWRLAQAGWQVNVYEQFQCFGGASGGAIGALVPHPPHRAHQKNPRMQRESIGNWPTFAAELSQFSGVDCGWRPIERWQVCMDAYRAKIAQENSIKTNGLWQYHQAPNIADIVFPQHGAALCHDTSCLDLDKFQQSLVTACKQSGVTILEYTPVTDLSTLKTDKTLVATGAWAHQLVPSIASKTAAIYGLTLRANLPNHQLTQMIRAGRTYIIPHGDELILGATLEPERGLNQLPHKASYTKLFQACCAYYPPLKDATITQVRAGLRPKSTSGEPIVEWLDDRTLVMTGLYGVGYGLLPWVSEKVVETLAFPAN